MRKRIFEAVLLFLIICFLGIFVHKRLNIDNKIINKSIFKSKQNIKENAIDLVKSLFGNRIKRIDIETQKNKYFVSIDDYEIIYDQEKNNNSFYRLKKKIINEQKWINGICFINKEEEFFYENKIKLEFVDNEKTTEQKLNDLFVKIKEIEEIELETNTLEVKIKKEKDKEEVKNKDEKEINDKKKKKNVYLSDFELTDGEKKYNIKRIVNLKNEEFKNNNFFFDQKKEIKKYIPTSKKFGGGRILGYADEKNEKLIYISKENEIILLEENKSVKEVFEEKSKNLEKEVKKLFDIMEKNKALKGYILKEKNIDEKEISYMYVNKENGIWNNAQKIIMKFNFKEESLEEIVSFYKEYIDQEVKINIYELNNYIKKGKILDKNIEIEDFDEKGVKKVWKISIENDNKIEEIYIDSGNGAEIQKKKQKK